MLNCLSTSTRRQVVNSFRSTKNDIIATCKIIQTGGQAIVKNPNDSQAMSIDPMEIILGFLLQALVKTPIGILKGYAESSEPNIAITSTAFKVARAFVPELSSFIIPAVSVPLGTVPTPITCPLPFINPILSMAYFATLAWYDDRPLEDNKNKTASELEKKIFKNQVICNEDTINQDLYYLDKSRIETDIYDLNKDINNQETLINKKQNDIQKAQEALNEQQKLLLEQQKAITDRKQHEIIQKIADEVKTKKYNDQKSINDYIPNIITFAKIKEFSSISVQEIDAFNGYASTTGDTQQSKNLYTDAVRGAESAVKNYIKMNLPSENTNENVHVIRGRNE